MFAYMKKCLYALVLLFAVASAISCKGEMDQLQSQIDIIRQGEIVSIKEQMEGINTSIKDLEKLDAQLQVYIQLLQTASTNLQTTVGGHSEQLTQLDASVKSLQTKEADIQSQITSLRTYVNTKLSEETDWANATFSTLEQYNATSNEITALKDSVAAVNTSVSELETRLDGKIAADIASAAAALQSQLDAVQARLTALEARLSSVESQVENLLRRIQSISVVPTFTDGSVGIKRVPTRLRFEVLPRSASVALAGLGVSAFSLDAVQAQVKSSSFTHLPIIAVLDNGEFLEVYVNGEALGDSFFSGTSGASARLKVSDGNNERASAFFGLTPDPSVSPDVTVFSESSNCYLVPSAGLYSFKTVKGNSSTSVGEVARAEVLWESFGTDKAPEPGDIIAKATYDSANPDFVTFTTPELLKNGNAVIAARDAGGNILWSWHIWVCKDYDPVATAHTYYNDAGVLMDRNLGATSATPGDIAAVGLLYQWGRKDPFLAGHEIAYPYSGTATRETAASTLAWPSPVASNASTGTIGYAIAHPTTFITANNNMDWYYSSERTTDNTRWQPQKTLYDPCPSGWRVPDGGSDGVWAKALGRTTTFSHSWDSDNAGMDFGGTLGSAGSIWYPAPGYLYMGSGGLAIVGCRGDWWSCTPSGLSVGRIAIYYDGRVIQDPMNRGFGISVRCLRE